MAFKYRQFMRKIFILGLSAFLFLIGFAVPAFAADPFTVTAVPVDAQGSSAIEAQTTAISHGQLAAANLLIERLTLQSDRSQAGWAGLDQQTAAKFIRGMEIANERRSASRYLGDITVAFNPVAVREYISAAGMNMITTQARMRLVLPVLQGQLWNDNGWRKAWEGPRYAHALTPMQGIQPGMGSASQISASQALSGNKSALAAIGAQYGVNQVLIANARQSGSQITVKLTDYALDTGRHTDFGTVSAYSYEDAVLASVKQIEDRWKVDAVNVTKNAETMMVSVLYRSHQDWQRLQEAINGSSQITDARLDALSKDGALMTIRYGGDVARLANELSFKGVNFNNDPKLGAVLTLTGRY